MPAALLINYYIVSNHTALGIALGYYILKDPLKSVFRNASNLEHSLSRYFLAVES
jgi:EamA domain-containing membrane protein RarD